MKKSLLFAALSAGIVLAGCTKEELIDPSTQQESQTIETATRAVTLPDEYAAPTSVIPEGAGAVRVTVNGVDPDATSLTFLADQKISGNFNLRGGVLEPVEGEAYEGNGVTVHFGSMDIVGGAANFMIPLPAGEYHDYSIVLNDEEGNMLYMKSEPDDADFTVAAGEVTQLGSDDAMTKGTTQYRPWQVWHTYSRSSTSAAFSASDNRYSVGQFLGGNCIMQGFHVLTTGNIVYSQNKSVSDVKRHLRIVKCTPKTNTSTFMTASTTESSYNSFILEDFSHGGGVTIEERSDGQYIWTGACGTIASGATELANHQAYVCFKPTWSFDNSKTVKHYTRDGLPHSSSSTVFYVFKPGSSLVKGFEVSVYSDKLCVEYVSSGVRYFKIYNLSAVKAVTPAQYTVNRAVSGTTTIYARNIASASCLATISFTNKSLAFQGFDFLKLSSTKYRIYALFGESLSTASTTSGNIVTKEWISGTGQCNEEYHAIKAFNGQTNAKNTLSACGFAKSCSCYNGYAEVEGIRVARNTTDQGEKIFVGFAAHDSADKRRANVLKFSRYGYVTE